MESVNLLYIENESALPVLQSYELGLSLRKSFTVSDKEYLVIKN